MRHNIHVPGHRFAIRPIDEADAAFIHGLRSRAAATRFLNRGAGSIEEQGNWLERYFDRADDYYFMIVDQRTTALEGALGLYDIDWTNRAGEWGRWVLREGSLAAVESAMLIYRCAFEVLDLQSVYCRTLVENTHVVSFHDRSGLRRNPQPGEIIVDGTSRAIVEHRLERAFWPSVLQRLAPIAKRIAQH